MTDEMTEKYLTTFLPHYYRKSKKLREDGTRFVHYTSAANALRIIDGETVWLRNTNLMNDFSEVQHGHDCIVSALNAPTVGGRMASILDQIESGLFASIESDYLESSRRRSLNSYMISVSEHGGADNREDLYGRLSMWRAYGGSTNVAFVFNSAPFLSESDALNAYTSPVLYADREIFNSYMSEVVGRLEAERAYLLAMGAQTVRACIGAALHFGALSTKHPGFAEEREWRIIFMPGYSVTGSQSDKVKSSIETVDGVPQRVYKIKLENYPDEGHFGATVPELLHEIIIGPTEYPWPIYDALVERLKVAGVQKAEQKVRVSNIPLRR